ncbi:MAG: aminotransferase class I/II-fold pyridoxal phosphate-dependent enzyme [Ardenticatenaceae bacterium]|nr:aminotransferase class I/II-fold pyridoxal phosphate-dependent enzyme [Ardenticatenaceae bacterium]
MAHMAQRVSHFGTTIFTEMTALAVEYNAVNLGQGFPDFAAPDFLKEAAIQAIQGDINQYAPASGRPRLKEAVAAKMQTIYGRSLNPHTEVVITHGATEAIFATIFGLVNPGDEVIIFEPYYDSYVPSVQMSGGIPRYYTLRPPDWAIDEAELAALFSDKTRLILLNTPHNPTGKVFTQEEMEMIARLCQKHDVIAVADEVYEHIIFDGRSHHQIASLPGMAERSVTISSLGKTFSATGWKVGWAIASPDLVQAIFRAHQFVTFCGAAPLQEATAAALETADTYYTDLALNYQQKRDFLATALRDAGLPPLPCHGTYFLMVDISHLGFANDVEFCQHLTKNVGVAAIPPSAFYHNPADGAGVARFAFCKKQETLETAVHRLRQI